MKKLLTLLAMLMMTVGSSFAQDYLKFYLPESADVESTNISFGTTLSGSRLSNAPKLAYSTDEITWTNYTLGTSLTVTKGSTIYFKAQSMNTTFNKNTSNYVIFTSDGPIYAGGNIMSLLDESCATTEVPEYAFHDLFNGCVGLVTAPELPATTLNIACYSSMFEGCTSLTKAPELKAKTLASSCYYRMFAGCSSLNEVTVGFTDWFSSATTEWLEDVAATGTFSCNHLLDTDYGGPSYIPEGWTVNKYNDDPLCITALEYTNISFVQNGTWDAPFLSYSTDGGATFNLYDYGHTLYLNEGDKVYFRNYDKGTLSESIDNYIQFTSTGNVAASGNILSLVYDENAIKTATSVPAFAFNHLFYNCDKLTAAPDLPATTLSEYCYSCMFNGCTGLTAAPELPATTLAENCYNSMFGGCTGLTAAPKLPATTLAEGCYNSMFSSCTGLGNAPELPATTLAKDCYNSMFSGCTGLTAAPYLPATTLAEGCYGSMFSNCENLEYVSVNFTDWGTSTYSTSLWLEGVASSGKFYCPAELEAKTGEDYIPEGWTAVYNLTKPDDCLCITAQENNVAVRFIKSESSSYPFANLPSIVYSTDGTIFHDYTYGDNIFLYDVGDQVYFMAKGKNATFSEGSHTYIQLYISNGKAAASGNVMSLLDNTCQQTSVPDYAFYELFYNSHDLTAAPTLPATTLGECCYGGMFANCENLFTAPALPATTLAKECYALMFSNCTGLTAAPELPATKLAEKCYQHMFRGCTNLSSVKVAFTDWNESGYSTSSWLSNVSATGTFTCPGTLAAQTGDSYVPEGWSSVCTFTELGDCLALTAEEDDVTVSFVKNELNDATFANTPSIIYSYDGTTFYEYTFGDEISLPVAGTKVYLMARGKNATFSESSDAYIQLKIAGGKAAASGNVMSLLDNTCQQTSVPAYAFYELFYCDTYLTKAPELPATTLGEYCYAGMFSGCTALAAAPVLPATTLAKYCYQLMFSHCESLTAAPVLPATTLAEHCYEYMFNYCSNLQTAPELPAKELAECCYAYMFYYCESLTAAPELPATQMASGCYIGMFEGCTNLSSIKVGFSDWYVNYSSTSGWLKDVAATGTFTSPIELEAKTGESYIPEGWTAVYNVTKPDDCLYFTAKQENTRIRFNKSGDNWKSVPGLVYSTDGSVFHPYTYGTDIILPNVDDKVYFMAKGKNATFSESADNHISITSRNTAFAAGGNIMSLLDYTCQQTSVPDYAFYYLFNGENYLAAAPELPATTLGENCYGYMFAYCKKLQAAPALPAKVMAPYCYQSMFMYCTSLTAVPELPATTLALQCYHTMFSGCTSLTVAPELPATTLASDCYIQMFAGCTGLTAAPELPAKELTPNCYMSMFDGCTSLSSVKVGFTDWNYYSSSTQDWLENVAATGTFVGPAELEQMTGTSYIPEGWTVGRIMTLPDDCLCLTAEQDIVQVRFNKNELNGETFANLPSIVYSTDGTTFFDYTYGDSKTLRFAGDKIYFMAKDKNETFSESKDAYLTLYITNGKAAASGNVMSLLDNTCQQTSVPDYAFYGLFYGDSYLTAAPVVPATTLGKYCYAYMFYSCSALTAAPELPATTLAPYCYAYMFAYCYNLTAAPELPATTLAEDCYMNMFNYCMSLTDAPALPAIELAKDCYWSMFERCTSLQTAPELPATTLASCCYYQMFRYCSKLNSVTVNFSTWHVTDYAATYSWLNGVAETGTFTCPAGLDQTQTGGSYIPNGWTVQTVAEESVVSVANLIKVLNDGTYNSAYDLDADSDVDLDDLNILVNKILKR